MKYYSNHLERDNKLGRQGAGRSAIVGKGFRHWEYSGQGGAYKQIGQTKIAAFTVVNAMGAILNSTN